MTILVLGNGFDLALKLPTSYNDFLKFAKAMKEFAQKPSEFDFANMKRFDIDYKVIQLIKEDAGNRTNNLFSYVKKFESIKENFWLYYFELKQEDLKRYSKVRWIDFEEEISKVGKEITTIVEKNSNHLDAEIGTNAPAYILSFMRDCFDMKYYRDIHDKICGDLDYLRWLLNFYLSRYVNRLDVDNYPPVLNNDLDNNDDIRIISFNYTNTVERCFGKYVKNIDYIHGLAGENEGDIVFGGKFDSDENSFLELSKAFQRVKYPTKYDYIRWLNEVKESKQKKIDDKNSKLLQESNMTVILDRLSKGADKMIIFGHSLGMTDSDIIGRLFSVDNMNIKVYCHVKKTESAIDESDKNEIIRNLHRILKEGEVEERKAEGKLEFCDCY